MNYRHAFHAGNFADLVKHATLLNLLKSLFSGHGPLTVVDTHAGRGLYDLMGLEAKKSGEAEAGIVRLMATETSPQAFDGLTSAVRKLNGPAAVRRYPGSPWLIADALRPGDSYLACELRPDEHGVLRDLMKGRSDVRTLCADGFEVAMNEVSKAAQVLVLIDPPFERADDYGRILETLSSVRRRNRSALGLVWLPLKDLETFDAFLRNLEDEVSAPLIVAETRMRPLTDPLKMNGCALVAMNAPDTLRSELEAVCDWTAKTLGQGGESRVYAL